MWMSKRSAILLATALTLIALHPEYVQRAWSQVVQTVRVIGQDGTTVSSPTNPLPVSVSGSGTGGLATAANQLAEIGVLEDIRDQNINAATPVAPATATATQGILMGCQFNTIAPTFADGQQGRVSCGPNGGVSVGGTIASGVADAGYPVKTGGVYNSSPSTLTTGNRGDMQLDSFGSLRVVMMNPALTGTSMGNMNTTVDGVTGPTGNQRMSQAASFNYFQSGANTWDRMFTCPNTAVVNVTAAATTEIVALTASQVIRVCSFAISMSAAGTAQFVTGTGTNCGTGTTSLTGAIPLATSTPLSISAGSGSVLRSSSGGALCVAAVTGNVVGFISYVKY